MDDKGHDLYVEDAPGNGAGHVTDQEYGEKKDLQYASEDIQEQTQVLHSPEDAERVRKYLWKLDCIILPTISALYFFEYLDRGNIANAKLLGIASGHDTKTDGVGSGTKALNATQWETVIMIFYVGLILFQVPGCIAYRIFPPSKWIAFSVCSWCVVVLFQCLCSSYAGLLVCRILLGTFEGLFGTGIVYYLTLWYRRDEMGLRVFWFLGPTAIAGAFGGLISYGTGKIASDIPKWKILFLIEGLPGFCLGAFCLYWLPDRPLKNSRFSKDQQIIAKARYYHETFDKAGKISMKHIRWAFSDWKLYAQAIIYVPTACLLSSISGFLPSIVQDLGYKSATSANLMTVPPYACAFAVMFATSWTSDHFRERGIHLICLSTIAAICYVCLATLGEDKLHAKYGLICIVVSCVYATYPVSHAWAINNFGNETKRAVGMGAYTAIGNCGSIAGSWFYPSTDAPLFRKGHWLCFGMSIATMVFSVSNHFLLRAVNKHRDKLYGKPIEGVPIDLTEDADKNNMFRFVT